MEEIHQAHSSAVKTFPIIALGLLSVGARLDLIRLHEGARVAFSLHWSASAFVWQRGGELWSNRPTT